MDALYLNGGMDGWMDACNCGQLLSDSGELVPCPPNWTHAAIGRMRQLISPISERGSMISEEGLVNLCFQFSNST